MQKHARIVLTVFCQCSSFIVNDITEIYQHLYVAGVQHDVNTSRKRRRRDADMRFAAAAAARRSVTIGGGGVSKMSAAHSCDQDRTKACGTDYSWRRGSVVRTSVCSWRTFPDLRLIHG